jgi:DnaJ-like protein
LSLEKFIDEQIKKAIAEGDFVNLPGSGQPIDLRAYFETPEDLRMCYSILKSGNFVPEEVELFREIEGLTSERDACPDQDQKARLNKTINDRRLGLRLLLERHR